MPEYYLDMERYFYDGGCIAGGAQDIKKLADLGDNFKISIAGNDMNKSEVGPYTGRVRIPCDLYDPDADIETLQTRLAEEQKQVEDLALARAETEKGIRDLQASYAKIEDEGGILKPKEEDALYAGEEFVTTHPDLVSATKKLKDAEAAVKGLEKDLKNFDDRMTTSMIGLTADDEAFVFNFSFTLTTYPYDDWGVRQDPKIPRYKHFGVPIREHSWDTEEQRTFPQTKNFLDELKCRGDGTAVNPLYDISSCADHNAEGTWLDCEIEYDVRICFEDLCNFCNSLNLGLIYLLVESLRQG
jgi:hypothetical protein